MPVCLPVCPVADLPGFLAHMSTKLDSDPDEMFCTCGLRKVEIPGPVTGLYLKPLRMSVLLIEQRVVCSHSSLQLRKFRSWSAHFPHSVNVNFERRYYFYLRFKAMDQLYMYNPESHGTPVFRVKVFFFSIHWWIPTMLEECENQQHYLLAMFMEEKWGWLVGTWECYTKFLFKR